MKEVDKIFKEKLENSGLNYKPEFWAEMEKVIENDKDKPMFWYFNTKVIGVLFLLLFAAIITSIGLLKDTNFKAQNIDSAKKLANAVDVAIQSPNTKNAKHTAEELNSIASSLKLKKSKDLVVPQVTPVASQTVKASVNNHEPFSPTASSHFVTSSSTNDKDILNSKGEKIALPHAKKESADLLTNEIKFTELFNENEDTKFLRTQKSLNESPSIANNYITRRHLFSISEGPKIDELLKTNFFTSASIKKRWHFSLKLAASFLDYSKESSIASLAIKQEEKTLRSSAYLIGVSANKGRWSITSGLNFLNLKEEVSYTSEVSTYSYDTSYSLLNPEFIQKVNGKWIGLVKREIDSTENISSNSICSSCPTSFTYIGVPLNLTYHLNIKKLVVFGELGITTNFAIRQRGYYSHKKDQLKAVNLKDQKVLSNVLFQSSYALGVKYPLRPRLNGFATLGQSRGLNSMIKSYDQKLVQNALTVGLEYKL